MFVCLKMYQLLLFTCFVIPFCLSNNIDIKVSPIRKNGNRASYFGYSATGVTSKPQPWIAVGSPKANSTKASTVYKRDLKETGALFKCPMTMDQGDCSDISVFQSDGSNYKFDPTDGWYGVSVSAYFNPAKTDEIGNVQACGHRISSLYFNQHANTTGIPGICSLIDAETIGDEVFMDSIHKNNQADLSGSSGDWKNVKVSLSRSRFGQMGISSMITAKYIENDNYFAGAVGEGNWRGAVVSDRPKKYPIGSQALSYGGYSVAAGDFFTKGKTGLAVGVPRYDLTGVVMVYETLKKDGQDTPTKILDGGQYGSYFGMSVCAADFDGDQLSEIVVGAPYYTDSLGKPAVGKAYVYGSKNDFSSPLLELKAKPTQAQAYFGRCVAALGDLDGNNFNDLGIGAPYEDGGAVYIYHGSSKGLSDKPVQIIHAADLPYQLKTFGWSIMGQVDLDWNGYPDIVVGAYASDAVVVLRSLPVIDVTAEYHLTPSVINVSNRSCSVVIDTQTIETVCLNVEITASYVDRVGIMVDTIELAFTLEADTMIEDKNRRRVRFEKTHDSTYIVTKAPVDHQQQKMVFKAKAYLRTDLCPDCEDKISPYPDIEFKLTYSLPKRTYPSSVPNSGAPPSLEKYFVLPYFTQLEDYKNVTSTSLLVKRACNPCKPDLKIKNVGTTKIPVNSAFVQLEIQISNKADQAYGVTFKAVFPPPLSVRLCGKLTKDAKCLGEPDCQIVKNSTEMTCSLGSIAGKAKNYVIEVATAVASKSLSTYKIPMNVSSGSEERAELLSDNFIELELAVESTADIGILRGLGEGSLFFGGTVRGQYSMTSYDQIGVKVEHKYTVDNKGPDVVPEVNFTINWPYEASNGKHLLYLIALEYNEGVQCYPSPGMVDPLAKQFKDNFKKVEILGEAGNRTRREIENADGGIKRDKRESPAVDEAKSGGTTSTVELDCRNNTAKCIHIPCTVRNLKANKQGRVTIKARLWNATLLEDYSKKAVRVFSSARIEELTGYVSDQNTRNHEAEMSTIFYPSTPKTTKKGIEVWIIIVSAIAGVVLLIILIVVFKMCGFFKRMDTDRYDQVPEK